MTDIATEAEVEISSPAANMLLSRHREEPDDVERAIETVRADVRDASKAEKIAGYDNVFVSRGHGLRTVFRREGHVIVVLSIATDD